MKAKQMKWKGIKIQNRNKRTELSPTTKGKEEWQIFTISNTYIESNNQRIDAFHYE